MDQRDVVFLLRLSLAGRTSAFLVGDVLVNMELRTITPAGGFKPIKPRGFKPASGVSSAIFHVDGPACFATTPKRMSPAKRRGKVFEKRALSALEEAGLFDLFVSSPWMKFEEPRSASRICQPDALGFHEGPKGPVATIIEIKLRHTILAYWQLRRLYEPVVKAAFPHYEIRVCELTQAFDPSVPWPEDVVFIQELEDLRRIPPASFGVLQWRP